MPAIPSQIPSALDQDDISALIAKAKADVATVLSDFQNHPNDYVRQSANLQVLLGDVAALGLKLQKVASTNHDQSLQIAQLQGQIQALQPVIGANVPNAPVQTQPAPMNPTNPSIPANQTVSVAQPSSMAVPIVLGVGAAGVLAYFLWKQSKEI